MFIAIVLRKIKLTNFIILVMGKRLMKSFEWKRLIGIFLSIFALSVGSVGLVGCEAESDGAAEELGEDIDEAAEDVEEEVEN